MKGKKKKQIQTYHHHNYLVIRKTELLILLIIIQLLIPPGSKSVYSLILIQHRVYIVVYIKKHSYQLVYDIIDTAKQSKVK